MAHGRELITYNSLRSDIFKGSDYDDDKTARFHYYCYHFLKLQVFEICINVSIAPSAKTGISHQCMSNLSMPYYKKRLAIRCIMYIFYSWNYKTIQSLESLHYS